MITRYSDANYRQMVPQGYQGVLPRRTRYGHDDAYELGLITIEESGLEILAWADVKEALDRSNEQQTQPQYHQVAEGSWADDDFKSDQDGLSYCWAWSAAATLSDLRAMEDKDTVILAPVSLGELVGWKNKGFYLDETASHLKKFGIAPASSVDGDFNSTNRNPNSFSDSNWKTTRLDYRLEEVIDINTYRVNDEMIIRQLATILSAGRSGYFAINSMSHAMSICGMEWSPSSYMSIKSKVRNSHRDPMLTVEGERWIPDEVICFSSTKLV